MRPVVLLFVLAGLALAQATPNPQFLTAVGAGFNTSATGQKVNGWTLFGTRVTNTMYTTSSMDLSGKGTSFRQGVEQILFQGFGLILTAKGDAGVATNSTQNLGGAFGGGGSVMFEVGKVVKVPGIYVVMSVTYLKTTIDPAQPVYRFGFAKTF